MQNLNKIELSYNSHFFSSPGPLREANWINLSFLLYSIVWAALLSGTSCFQTNNKGWSSTVLYTLLSQAPWVTWCLPDYPEKRQIDDSWHLHGIVSAWSWEEKLRAGFYLYDLIKVGKAATTVISQWNQVSQCFLCFVLLIRQLVCKNKLGKLLGYAS